MSKHLVMAAVLCLGCGLGAWAQETAPEEGLILNFQDVPLDTVLDYLSEAAGFVIVREVPVSGNVTAWSRKPLNKDEAVDLLNTILNNRGFAAIRQERTLTIVNRDDAKKRNLPVRMSSDPESIPVTDEMVTQIIPMRYAEAQQLLENIKELLPDYAVATANTTTNSIVLTDTQANVRRVAEIVTALDNAISGGTEVRVFHLKQADAEETATLVTQLFQQTQGGTSRGGSQRSRMMEFFSRMRRGGGPPGMPGGPGGPGGDSGSDGDSQGRTAASSVTAVADERANAVVVAAPQDVMPLIVEIIEDLDSTQEEVMEMRVFLLEHADAEETADLIGELFQSNTRSNQRKRNAQRFGGGGPMGMMMMMPGGQQQGSGTAGDYEVTAVADVRTNAVVVTATPTALNMIAEMIAALDENPAKKRKVFVYPLENADAEEVAGILEQTFSGSSTSSSRSTNRNATNRNTTNRNTQTNRNNSSSRTR